MERFLFVKQDNNRRVMQSRAAISSGLYFQVPWGISSIYIVIQELVFIWNSFKLNNVQNGIR